MPGKIFDQQPRLVLGEPCHRPSLIPTESWLQICRHIELERGIEGRMFEQSLADRWQRLTIPLLLEGGKAMRPTSSGGFTGLQVLAEAVPWAGSVITEVERQLRTSLALGRPWIRLEPMLLLGPPGIGKTWIARQLGQVLGLDSAVLELGGASDDRMLGGTARGWTNTQPAWPLVVMAQTGIANPLLVLDEVDKAGGSARNGCPHNTLLAMTEPASSRAYHDQCLLADCDLSQVNWIACANELAPIPVTLRSRFHVIDLDQPEPEHFEAVLKSVFTETANGWELPPHLLPDLPNSAIALLRERFARNRSIRTLARDARALLGAALADHHPSRH